MKSKDGAKGSVTEVGEDLPVFVTNRQADLPFLAGHHNHEQGMTIPAIGRLMIVRQGKPGRGADVVGLTLCRDVKGSRTQGGRSV
jgi:hypothetical protein